MTIHELKCDPKPFEDILWFGKRFELREDDRGYEVNDYLYLKETSKDRKTYTGRSLLCKVTYILRAKDCDGYGLCDDHVIMSIDDIREGWKPGVNNNEYEHPMGMDNLSYPMYPCELQLRMLNDKLNEELKKPLEPKHYGYLEVKRWICDIVCGKRENKFNYLIKKDDNL